MPRWRTLVEINVALFVESSLLREGTRPRLDPVAPKALHDLESATIDRFVASLFLRPIIPAPLSLVHRCNSTCEPPPIPPR